MNTSESPLPADNEPKPKPNKRAQATGGGLWFIGWLFTIGFCELGVAKAIWALFVWPYYLGQALRIAILA